MRLRCLKILLSRSRYQLLYSQSFKAYQNWITRHGEEPRLPGMNLTNEQIFFISFARVSNLLHNLFSVSTTAHVMRIQLCYFQTVPHSHRSLLICNRKVFGKLVVATKEDKEGVYCKKKLTVVKRKLNTQTPPTHKLFDGLLGKKEMTWKCIGEQCKSKTGKGNLLIAPANLTHGEMA